MKLCANGSKAVTVEANFSGIGVAQYMYLPNFMKQS